MSRPSNSTLPPVGSSSRVISRPVVVLPQPDSPTSDSVSPRSTSKSRPSTARTAPTWRCRSPRRTGKCFSSPLATAAGRARRAVPGSARAGSVTATPPPPRPGSGAAGRRRGGRRPGGPAPTSRSSGRSVSASPPVSSRSGSAGGTGSPAAGRAGSAGCRGSAPAGPAAPCRSAAPTPAGPTCRGARGRKHPRAGPYSTPRPAYITRMSSATSATTPRSWVMSMTAESNSACRSRIRSRICACTVTSSAVVGSSAISRSGLYASAMAIIARCRMPPENLCG